MSRMKPGICQLCLKQTELAFSHIYPEFFYETAYDDSHSFISISSHPRQPVRPFQKGFREYLLCKECESRFSRYESYAASLLRKTSAMNTDFKRSLTITTFDYTTLKLFALSIIWRCHSSRLHIFGDVKLGSHAKQIHRMLLSEEPGEPNQYGFILVKIEGSKMAQRTVLPPQKTKFGNLTSYFYAAMGFEWIFIASKIFQVKSRHFPLVGLSPKLSIPIWRQTDQEFIRYMRTRIPKSLLEKEKPD